MSVAVSRPHVNDDADNTLTSVDGASGSVYAVIVENTDATDTVYVQIFDADDAVVGTTAKTFCLPCEPGVSGFYFAKLVIGNAGIHYAVTSTPAGNTAPPSTVRVYLTYG